jgi:hypothetical protein
MLLGNVKARSNQIPTFHVRIKIWHKGRSGTMHAISPKATSNRRTFVETAFALDEIP